jgi:RNA recognition motif-containing protein
LHTQVVMLDRTSKLPRGFGFVTFRHPEAAAEAVQTGPHAIDERLVRVVQLLRELQRGHCDALR